MQIMDILGEMGGIQSVARELGISESQAASGAAALVPALMGGFKSQAQAHPTGLDGLAGMLGGLGGRALMDAVLNPQPTDVSRGHDVLGQIFGSPDVSHKVAQHAATQTGLDPSLIRKMLPVLAMLVAGYLAKQHSASVAPPSGGGAAGGGLGEVLGGLLGGGRGAASGGAPGLTSMLDLDGDGNPLDDILNMAGKLIR
jgi:hypothetical protein